MVGVITGVFEKIKKFLSEVKSELSKVIWPTRQELIESTIVSLFFIFLFAVYLGALDLVFYKLVKLVF